MFMLLLENQVMLLDLVYEEEQVRYYQLDLTYV